MEPLIIEEGKELQHRLDGRKVIALSSLYVNKKAFLGAYINEVTGAIQREMINVNEVEDIDKEVENRKGEWKDGYWVLV